MATVAAAEKGAIPRYAAHELRAIEKSVQKTERALLKKRVGATRTAFVHENRKWILSNEALESKRQAYEESLNEYLTYIMRTQGLKMAVIARQGELGFLAALPRNQHRNAFWGTIVGMALVEGPGMVIKPLAVGTGVAAGFMLSPVYKWLGFKVANVTPGSKKAKAIEALHEGEKNSADGLDFRAATGDSGFLKKNWRGGYTKEKNMKGKFEALSKNIGRARLWRLGLSYGTGFGVGYSTNLSIGGNVAEHTGLSDVIQSHTGDLGHWLVNGFSVGHRGLVTSILSSGSRADAQTYGPQGPQGSSGPFSGGNGNGVTYGPQGGHGSWVGGNGGGGNGGGGNYRGGGGGRGGGIRLNGGLEMRMGGYDVGIYGGAFLLNQQSMGGIPMDGQWHWDGQAWERIEWHNGGWMLHRHWEVVNHVDTSSQSVVEHHQASGTCPDKTVEVDTSAPIEHISHPLTKLGGDPFGNTSTDKLADWLRASGHSPAYVEAVTKTINEYNTLQADLLHAQGLPKTESPTAVEAVMKRIAEFNTLHHVTEWSSGSDAKFSWMASHDKLLSGGVELKPEHGVAYTGVQMETGSYTEVDGTVHKAVLVDPTTCNNWSELKIVSTQTVPGDCVPTGLESNARLLELQGEMHRFGEGNILRILREWGDPNLYQFMNGDNYLQMHDAQFRSNAGGDLAREVALMHQIQDFFHEHGTEITHGDNKTPLIELLQNQYGIGTAQPQNK